MDNDKKRIWIPREKRKNKAPRETNKPERYNLILKLLQEGKITREEAEVLNVRAVVKKQVKKIRVEVADYRVVDRIKNSLDSAGLRIVKTLSESEVEGG